LCYRLDGNPYCDSPSDSDGAGIRCFCKSPQNCSNSGTWHLLVKDENQLVPYGLYLKRFYTDETITILLQQQLLILVIATQRL